MCRLLLFKDESPSRKDGICLCLGYFMTLDADRGRDFSGL